MKTFRYLNANSLVLCACAVFAAVFAAGCQTVINDPVALPHDEKIVVEAFIESGKPVERLLIESTVGALDTLTPSLAFVSDAEVTISVDGRSYKGVLKPDSSAYVLFYGVKTLRSAYAVPGLIAQSGKTYDLTVSWHGKTATAQTRVPAVPTLVKPIETVSGADTVRNRRSTTVRRTLRVKASVNAVAGEVYEMWLYASQADGSGADVVFYNSVLSSRSSGQILKLPVGVSADNLSLNTTFTLYSYPLNTASPPNPFASARTTAVIHAYDEAYYDYATTLERARNSGDNALANAGLNPLWNVRGDGVGVFVGMARRETKVSVP